MGATVVVTDVQRGITRTLTTDEAGQYLAPNLLPGEYSVRAESKGFKAVERLNIGFEVGKDVRIDFVLPAGDVTRGGRGNGRGAAGGQHQRHSGWNHR